MNLFKINKIITDEPIFSYGKNLLYKYSDDYSIKTWRSNNGPSRERFKFDGSSTTDTVGTVYVFNLGNMIEYVRNANTSDTKFPNVLFIVVSGPGLVVTDDTRDFRLLSELETQSDLMYGSALWALNCVLLKTKTIMPKFKMNYPFEMEFLK